METTEELVVTMQLHVLETWREMLIEAHADLKSDPAYAEEMIDSIIFAIDVFTTSS